MVYRISWLVRLAAMTSLLCAPLAAALPNSSFLGAGEVLYRNADGGRCVGEDLYVLLAPEESVVTLGSSSYRIEWGGASLNRADLGCGLLVLSQDWSDLSGTPKKGFKDSRMTRGGCETQSLKVGPVGPATSFVFSATNTCAGGNSYTLSGTIKFQ